MTPTTVPWPKKAPRGLKAWYYVYKGWNAPSLLVKLRIKRGIPQTWWQAAHFFDWRVKASEKAVTRSGDFPVPVPAWAWKIASDAVFEARRQLKPLFRLNVAFVDNLSAFPIEQAQKAYDAGYRLLPVLIDPHDDAGDAPRNLSQFSDRAPGLIQQGWTLGGWSAPCSDASSTEADARTAAQRAVSLVQKLGLKFWITNWETWGEADKMTLPVAFLDEWMRLGNIVPLGLACLSSNTSKWARKFMYQPWVEHGIAIMPEVYGNVDPSFSVANMLATFKLNKVPRSLLVPIFGCWDAGREIPWADYASWKGQKALWPIERTAVFK